VGSSWFSGEEGKKGMIAPGQLADIAVLSADYLTVPEEKIKGMESVLTIVGGKVVYGAQEFSTLAPPQLPVSPDWAPVGVYGGYHRAVPHSHKASSCCLHSAKLHPAHLSVLSSSGERWPLGCDCFAF
jgi:hypothetical protein